MPTPQRSVSILSHIDIHTFTRTHAHTHIPPSVANNIIVTIIFIVNRPSLSDTGIAYYGRSSLTVRRHQRPRAFRRKNKYVWRNRHAGNGFIIYFRAPLGVLALLSCYVS